MIKNIYTLGIALLLGCSSCNDWLTVQPETVIVTDNLTTTDDGIKQILNGMFLTMRGTLYAPGAAVGGSGLAEALACTWYQVGDGDIALGRHDYTSEFVQGTLNSAFCVFYDVIAMANDLINGAEVNKDNLSTPVYNVGVGEASAIRALCHFDLIRFWGPMPSRVDATRNYLPYVTVNSTERYEYITYEKYMALLFEDLNRAEELLKQSDPIVTDSFEETETTGAEWPYRKSRMNYYGVLGLQARVRLWYGDIEGALRYARAVRDARNADETPKFRLMVEDDIDYDAGTWGDGMCGYSEHLCGTKCNTYDVEKSGWMSGRAYNCVYDSEAFDKLFDSQYDDVRYSRLWQYERTGWMFRAYVMKKYSGFYPGTKAMTNFPIIRLAEMYLIIMEKGTLEEANTLLEEFCAARNIPYEPYTNADRADRVYKEWLRELIGEGQNFFTYKRYGVNKMLFSEIECTNEQYVLPIPEKEYWEE